MTKSTESSIQNPEIVMNDDSTSKLEMKKLKHRKTKR